MKRRTSVFARFRIYPNERLYPRNRHGRYFRVVVFKSHAGMIRYCAEMGLGQGRGFTARFIRQRSSKGLLGILIFCREEICAGAPVHEIVHAVNSVTPKHRQNIFKEQKDEEQFARMVDTLTAQFWRCYKHRPQRGDYG